MELYLILMILITDHRDTLINWCSENMSFCCALFMTAHLQFMPYVKHLPFAKAESPSEKHSLHAATFGRWRQKDSAFPESQEHGQQGRSATKLKWRVEHHTCGDKRRLSWLFTILLTGNESCMSGIQERHLHEYCMQILQYRIRKC